MVDQIPGLIKLGDADGEGIDVKENGVKGKGKRSRRW